MSIPFTTSCKDSTIDKYLVRDINPPILFPLSYPQIFISFAVEKENKLFIVPKLKKNSFWPLDK
jgi:hypothetical protein